MIHPEQARLLFSASQVNWSTKWSPGVRTKRKEKWKNKKKRGEERGKRIVSSLFGTRNQEWVEAFNVVAITNLLTILTSPRRFGSVSSSVPFASCHLPFVPEPTTLVSDSWRRQKVERIGHLFSAPPCPEPAHSLALPVLSCLPSRTIEMESKTRRACARRDACYTEACVSEDAGEFHVFCGCLVSSLLLVSFFAEFERDCLF